jgi:hypothetical protein
MRRYSIDQYDCLHWLAKPQLNGDGQLTQRCDDDTGRGLDQQISRQFSGWSGA